ncbi:MAG: hypothetical protein ACM37U_11835, partial [Gemmatimonas sp.]
MSASIRSIRVLLGALAICLPPALTIVAPAGAQASPMAFDPTEMASALRFRYIGPVGNRTDAVAGVPGDPNTYYAG